MQTPHHEEVLERTLDDQPALPEPRAAVPAEAASPGPTQSESTVPEVASPAATHPESTLPDAAPPAATIGGTPAEDIEEAIRLASGLLDRGDSEGAERVYLEADRRLGSERSPRHAEVLVCLALLARRRGELALAGTRLDLALGSSPEHRAALSQRLAIAEELRDSAMAAALRKRMLRFCESDRARVHVLAEVVSDAVMTALSALRDALALSPQDRELWEQLRALLEATSDWSGAVDASVALAELTRDPVERAATLAHAARLCATRVGHTERAVALFEAAIADDPTVPGAFSAIEAVLVEAGDVEGLERALVRQWERLRAGAHREEELVLLRKLASHREDRLADFGGARAAFERIFELAPDDAGARVAIARLLEADGHGEQARSYLEQAIRLTPTEPAAYRALLGLELGRGQRANAFFAASALVHLGEAEDTEQALYREYADAGVPSAERGLDASIVVDLRPGPSHAARAILAVIHDAAVEARLRELRAKKQIVLLDESTRQRPEESTVAAVRATAWVARLLGLGDRDLFIDKTAAYALAHPMTERPSVVLGAGMLRGRSMAELLFRAGYELALEGELGRLPVFFPSVAELTTLVAAAIGLCMPRSLPSDAIAMTKQLDQTLELSSKVRLTELVEGFMKDGVVIDAAGMLRDLELFAGRVGLLACSDLTVAARQVTIESRATIGLRPTERVRDLLAFSVSEAHLRIREALGLALGDRRGQS